MPSLSSTFLYAAAIAAGAAAFDLPNILVKDVAIIGGGAAGAYAAVRLRDDENASIALVEMQGRLGGMVNTYIDPSTGTAYDYGVESFLGLGNASAFFERFNIATTAVPSANVTTEYIDFISGDVVNLTLPSIDDELAAFQSFLDIVEPWTDYLQPGYWNFPQGSDIPEDFLITYGEFITKYGLQDIIPIAYDSTGIGLGNITAETTMFVLQAFGTYMAQDILGDITSWAAADGNQALYNAIEEDLGDDVLYNSTVLSSLRTDYGVILTVQNNVTGQITLLSARQLLIAIEPTPSNLAPFDLNSTETEIFSKFTFSRLYDGIVNNTAFAAPYSYTNMAAGAAPDNYLVLPNFPFTNEFSYMGADNLFHVILVGDVNFTTSDALDLAQENFETLLKAGRLAEAYDGQELEWVDFSIHGPMHARVAAEDVQAGFYTDLYSLQGSRSTWWTGGAISCNFQTTLWEFDETLIPKIVDNLNTL